MEWSEEHLIQLIDSYKLKTLLWDPKNKHHFKKHLKEDAWREISEETGRCVEECKKKMSILLALYRREKLKEKKSKGTGKGIDEVYVSRWFGYEPFRFLEDRDLPRKRQCTDIFEECADNEGDTEGVAEQQINPEPSEERRQGYTPVVNSPIPSRTKRKKEERDATSSMMASAFEILETAASKLNNPSSQPDEITSFLIMQQ